MHPQSWRPKVVPLFAFIIATASSFANGTEFFSWLAVRYPDQSVKTFLQGHFASKPRCEQLNQSTWDNVLTACGSCKVDEQFCSPISNLRDGYAKALRKERAAFPYVVATPNGRIIISGVPTHNAVAECHRLADRFKENGYEDARCILP